MNDKHRRQRDLAIGVGLLVIAAITGRALNWYPSVVVAFFGFVFLAMAWERDRTPPAYDDLDDDDPDEGDDEDDDPDEPSSPSGLQESFDRLFRDK